MNEIQPASLVRFIQSIVVLSSDFSTQERWLNGRGFYGPHDPVDEIAMEFDDGFIMLDTFIKLGWLSGKIRQDLEFIDRKLEEMSSKKNYDLWSFESLKSSPSWDQVRAASRKASILLA